MVKKIQFVTNLKVSRKPTPKHLTCTNEGGFAVVKLSLRYEVRNDVGLNIPDFLFSNQICRQLPSSLMALP